MRRSTRERLRSWGRDARFAAAIAAAAWSVERPVLCFLTVTRRCNLSCGYCFEYDDVSPPVPYERLQASIQHLARLDTVMVTLNGGEPLLHPRVADLVRLIAEHGMFAGLNTNGFLLTRPLIERLNEAQLFAIQLSIDSLVPNATTQKSLKTLRGKLALLAEHAVFRVHVNTVLGSAPAEQARAVARVVREHGFATKAARVRGADGGALHADRAPVSWRCRAGARYFHVCEHGLVHLCGPKLHRGTTPLLAYTVEDIRRELETVKPCAARCAVAYAHQISRMDALRPQARPATRTASGRRSLQVIGD